MMHLSLQCFWEMQPCTESVDVCCAYLGDIRRTSPLFKLYKNQPWEADTYSKQWGIRQCEVSHCKRTHNPATQISFLLCWMCYEPILHSSTKKCNQLSERSLPSKQMDGQKGEVQGLFNSFHSGKERPSNSKVVFLKAMGAQCFQNTSHLFIEMEWAALQLRLTFKII